MFAQTEQNVISVNLVDKQISVLQSGLKQVLLFEMSENVVQKQHGAMHQLLSQMCEQMTESQHYIKTLVKITDRDFRKEAVLQKVKFVSPDECGEAEFVDQEKQLIKMIQGCSFEQMLATIQASFQTMGYIRDKDEVLAETPPDEMIQAQINAAFAVMPQKLQDCCVFACLRSQQLLQILVKFIQLTEQRIARPETFLVYNVRPIAAICQALVDLAVQVLQ